MNLDPKNIKIHVILIVLAGFVSIPIVIMLYASFRNGGIQNYLTPLTHSFFIQGFPQQHYYCGSNGNTGYFHCFPHRLRVIKVEPDWEGR